jgi:hypothetical protein
VSHAKERKEKICLNCNAELNGRFCHICGQENIEPKESAWGLISHFLYDITHFDGKFFKTTGLLIRRPGFLPKEYLAGRRARYLHPIRMYVFTSAFFFLILFSLYSGPDINLDSNKKKEYNSSAKDTILSVREKMLRSVSNKEDSAAIAKVFDKAFPVPVLASAKPDRGEIKEKKGKNDGPDMNVRIYEPEVNYKDRPAYDSIQKSLPEAQRDGWWKRLKTRRSLEIKAKYDDNRKLLIKELIERVMHTFPYLLFISLPLYALFLKLLYFRHKQFYYVNHGIFLIYLYIFTFLFLLLYFGLIELRNTLGWNWIGWLEAGFLLYGVYYAWRAMHRFYGQGRGKTLLKFFLLNLMSFISLIILFGLFFILAVFRV